MAGDEIDPVAELNLQATVAHEVLQSDSLDDARPGTLAEAGDRVTHGWVGVRWRSREGQRQNPRRRD